MSIKLIAVDMDRTLLTTDQRITPTNETAIRDAMTAGIEFILNTGRSDSECRAFYPQLPMHYSIFSNGSYIVDFKTGETIYSRTIDIEDAREIYEIYARYDPIIFVQADHWVYARDDFPEQCKHFPEYIEGIAPTGLPYRFVPDMRQFLKERKEVIEKFHVSFISHEVAKMAYNELVKLPFRTVWCGKYCVEVSHPEADKGRTLGILADMLGIEIEDVAAIGDSGNDETMLESAGFSVVVDNAPEYLKDKVSMVVSSNDRNGVAEAIDYILDSGK